MSDTMYQITSNNWQASSL